MEELLIQKLFNCFPEVLIQYWEVRPENLHPGQSRANGAGLWQYGKKHKNKILEKQESSKRSRSEHHSARLLKYSQAGQYFIAKSRFGEDASVMTGNASAATNMEK